VKAPPEEPPRAALGAARGHVRGAPRRAFRGALVTKALAGLLVLALAGCGARDPGPGAAPLGPPFAAWLETTGIRGGADELEVTLVVMPLHPLGTPGRVAVEGRAARTIDALGGRLAFRFGRAEPVRIEATWGDPGGAAGARAVMVYPAQPVAAVEFVPIVGHRLGRDGPIIDRAIRIGRMPAAARQPGREVSPGTAPRAEEIIHE